MNEPKKRKKADFLKLTMYTAVFGIMGGVSFYGLDRMDSNTQENTPKVVNVSSTKGIISTSKVTNENLVNAAVSNKDTNNGVSVVADAVLPCIVQIHVKASQTISGPFGEMYEQEGTGSGSGIIVGQNENHVYIVTNNHVVADSTEVTIQFNDETKASATVKGIDSMSDIAVVSVKLSDLTKDTVSKIRVARLGDSSECKVGQQAIALGNALGYGTSVTAGYISAKDREVSFEDKTMTLLQTDAAINPGNSGGALVNTVGEVIGINSAKFADNEVEGMGFAIPISDAIPIINRLINQETIPESEKAYLGITGNEVSLQMTQLYNMPEGILIASVTKDSPAEVAGLKKGDIITAIDGEEMKTTARLKEYLATKKTGDSIAVTVMIKEDGQYIEEEINVKLHTPYTNNKVE